MVLVELISFVSLDLLRSEVDRLGLRAGGSYQGRSSFGLGCREWQTCHGYTSPMGLIAFGQ
jgi:hypothetical protein